MLKFKKPIIVILTFLVLGGAVAVWSQRQRLVVEDLETEPEIQGVQEEAATTDLVLDFGEEKITTYSGVKTTEKRSWDFCCKPLPKTILRLIMIPPAERWGLLLNSLMGWKTPTKVSGSFGLTVITAK